MADRKRLLWTIAGQALVLVGILALACLRMGTAGGNDMKVELVALPIVQGTIDIAVGGQNPFLWKLQEFATRHGFEISGIELPGNNKSYSFRMVRDDLLLSGTSDAVGIAGFNPVHYQFFFSRNVYQHNKLESDDPYRAEVDRLAADFQLMLKPVASVAITPPKAK